MAKHVRKVPATILARVASFGADNVIVAWVKKLSRDDVSTYGAWGLTEDAGRLVATPRIPPKRFGRYSAANIDGLEVVRRDLPKYPKTYMFQAPSWKGSGTHTVSQERLVYPRDFIAPRGLQIGIQQVEKGPPGIFHLRFSVEQVLDRKASDFNEDLLFNLNLLMEVTGGADVFPSDMTLEEYAKTVRLTWDVLPPGKVDEVLERMLRGKPPVSIELRKGMEERLKVLHRFQPQSYLAGTSGFLRYFGAMFRDDLVVFENVEYGNALYAMYADWKVLSQRSRIDLLKGPRDGFDRIEHRRGWEKQLRALLRSKDLIV
jgi:hypothetical protein